MQEKIFKANRTVLKLYGLMFVLVLLPVSMLRLRDSADFASLTPFFLVLLACVFGLLLGMLELAVSPMGIRQYPRFKFVDRLGGTTSFTIPYAEIKYIEVGRLGAFNGKTLSITTTAYKKYVINSIIYSDFDQIIRQLKQYVDFDAHVIVQDIPGMEDIGERVKYVLGAGVVLLIWGLVMAVALLSDWHLSSENMFDWLKYSVPAAILLAYIYIRQEKKPQALLAAIISGVVLGAGFNFVLLQGNRLYTEFNGQTRFYTFHYADDTQQRGQKWLPPAEVVTHDGYFYVHPDWNECYAAQLQVGKSYRIAIKQGYLNDWAFTSYAFKQAKEINVAQASHGRE